MKINRRQEIAMWVLGLFLVWMLLPRFYPDDGIPEVIARVTRNPVSLLVEIVIVVFLIVFSLRDRKKPD